MGGEGALMKALPGGRTSREMSCRLTVHPPSRTACVFAVVEWVEKGGGHGAKVGGALWRDRLDRAAVAAALPIWFPQLAGTDAQAAACAVALPTDVSASGSSARPGTRTGQSFALSSGSLPCRVCPASPRELRQT